MNERKSNPEQEKEKSLDDKTQSEPAACKGCGVLLQYTHPDQPGYSPKEGAEYCQRCYRLRHYGDLTYSMAQGIANQKTIEQINKIDGVIFWIADVFDLEANLQQAVNEIKNEKILILTKRDLLPGTLSDDKLLSAVKDRLKERGLEAANILLAGDMQKNNENSEMVIEELKDVIDYYGQKQKKDIIFAGLANAGKSTLLNRLIDKPDLTISRFPGTTLDLVKIPWKDGFLYDSPGLENHHSYQTQVPAKELKKLIPSKMIKPITFQIHENQSFAIGGLARLDVYTKSQASVVFYLSDQLQIHRGKLEKADELWKRHIGTLLAPAIDHSIEEMACYEIPKIKKDEKLDVVISGLGWITLSGKIEKALIYVHQGIHVTFRKAMI